MVRALANQLLSALFEPPCAACTQTLSAPLDGAVCDECWNSITAHACLDPPSPFGRRRGRLFHASETVTAVAAIGEYEGRLRDIIHALKYDGRRSIAPRLGALMRASGQGILDGAHVAVPVPLHPRRERMRGFNQAHDLAIHLGLPVEPLLRRVAFTVPQVDLSGDERRANVRNAFSLRRSTFAPRASADRSAVGQTPPIVVLIDDVSTTGATLEACARVLKGAGVNEVRALTAARVSTARL